MTNTPTNYSSPAAAHSPSHGGYPGTTTTDPADCARCKAVFEAEANLAAAKSPDYRGPCPRCGQRVPNNHPDHDYPGALSREDNETYVCSECGTTEAMSAFMPSYPAPLPLGSFGRVAA